MTPKQILRIIVHCTRTAPGMDIGITEINRWHRARGCLKVGYHWIIRRCGDLEKGRPESEAGNHTRGYNDKSIAVCLVGGADMTANPADNFTGPQLDTLAALLRDLKDRYPLANIIGHDQAGGNPDCPAFDVQAWLNTVTI